MAKQSVKRLHALLGYLPHECARSWADSAIADGVPEEYRTSLESIASGVFSFAWGVCRSFYSISDGNLSFDDEDIVEMF